MASLPLVSVVWLDSQSLCDRPWFSHDEARELRIATIRSVGHVVYEDHENLVLALSVAPDEYGGVKAIPKVAISSRCELKPVAVPVDLG